MRLSTIMVCYNASATIAGAVRSFLSQDYSDKELVVIDGASTDGTQDIVASFNAPSVRLFSEPDKGIYDAMNKGLSRFSGDAFGFLNADDRYHDTKALSRIAEALEKFEMVTGNLNFVAAHDGAPPVRFWPAARHEKGAFRKGWMPPHPTTYARRAIYERTGPFETVFKIAGDYDWMLRALEIEGATHGTIDHILVDMAMGGVSTAGPGAHLRNAKEMLKSRQMRLGSGALDIALLLGPLGKLGQLRPMSRLQNTSSAGYGSGADGQKMQNADMNESR